MSRVCIRFQWVRQRYIDPAPLGNRIIRDPSTGLERVFIPSRVDNNQHIDVEAYKQRLRASGSKELVRAWLDGDWSVAMGAFFDCGIALGTSCHRLRSRRTGCASVRWTGARPRRSRLAGGRSCRMITQSPTGARPAARLMVRYREWYGKSPGSRMSGSKLHAEEVGKGIAEREQGESIA